MSLHCSIFSTWHVVFQRQVDVRFSLDFSSISKDLPCVQLSPACVPEAIFRQMETVIAHGQDFLDSINIYSTLIAKRKRDRSSSGVMACQRNVYNVVSVWNWGGFFKFYRNVHEGACYAIFSYNFSLCMKCANKWSILLTCWCYYIIIV